MTRELLDEYPVWSELYSPDEWEEIVGWGYDEAWLRHEHARVNPTDRHEHLIYPMLEVNPFGPAWRVYIRARFRTPGGQSLTGYLVGEDARPAVGVFHGDESFIFNRNLIAEAREDVATLRALLAADPEDPILPLAYETDFTDELCNCIAGSFDLGDPE